MIPFLISTFGPIIHAAMWNKDYLTILAHKPVWYAQPGAPPAGPPSPSFLGVGNSDYLAPGSYRTTPAQTPPAAAAPVPPTGAAQLDINRATASALTSDLRIDPALADHVIAVRDVHGGYRNLDHLAMAANLQPHQLVRFRSRVTFGADPGQQSPPTGPAGRILDY
jgi:hypothetical protein